MLATDRPKTIGARLSGRWAITARGQATVRQAVAGFDWTSAANDPMFDQRETKVANGVAVIPLIGAITKYAEMYDRYCGFISAEWIEAEIDRLEADPSVIVIVLLTDTPGGMVDGSTQLASRIKRCTKRIICVVSDCCCSAGLWIATQCTLITANAVADIGSIGVVAMFLDDSEYLKNLGFVWHTVATSDIKAAGQDGHFNDTLKAEWQRSVDDTYQQFIQVISDGRGIPIDDVRRLADGRVFRAAEAASLKLIDRVQDAAVAIDAITQEVIEMTQQEFMSMAASNPEWVKPITQQAVTQLRAELQPKNATASELKQAFNAPEDKDFLVERMDTEAAMADHKAAYADHLKTRMAAKDSEMSTLKQQLATIDPALAGLPKPVNTPNVQPNATSPLAASVQRVNSANKPRQ